MFDLSGVIFRRRSVPIIHGRGLHSCRVFVAWWWLFCLWESGSIVIVWLPGGDDDKIPYCSLIHFGSVVRQSDCGHYSITHS